MVAATRSGESLKVHQFAVIELINCLRLPSHRVSPTSLEFSKGLVTDVAGLKKITLKVRVTDSAAAFKASSPRAAFSELDLVPQQVIDPNGMPSPPIMRHLLDVFFIHFGCQFPFLNKVELDNEVDRGTGSAFLFNAIAAVAAR